jgi:murein tripeptide amidase MpaA
VILISARVHPGESPSSIVMESIMESLLRGKEKSAEVLLWLFVFKLVPMVNPDGVYHGHYRLDTLG